MSQLVQKQQAVWASSSMWKLKLWIIFYSQEEFLQTSILESEQGAQIWILMIEESFATQFCTEIMNL